MRLFFVIIHYCLSEITMDNPLNPIDNFRGGLWLLIDGMIWVFGEI